MIPYFKHKGTLAALDDIEKSKVVDVSKYPKGVVADLKGYDESIFFFYGYHPFVFVDTKIKKRVVNKKYRCKKLQRSRFLLPKRYRQRGKSKAGYRRRQPLTYDDISHYCKATAIHIETYNMM